MQCTQPSISNMSNKQKMILTFDQAAKNELNRQHAEVMMRQQQGRTHRDEYNKGCQIIAHY